MRRPGAWGPQRGHSGPPSPPPSLLQSEPGLLAGFLLSFLSSFCPLLLLSPLLLSFCPTFPASSPSSPPSLSPFGFSFTFFPLASPFPYSLAPLPSLCILFPSFLSFLRLPKQMSSASWSCPLSNRLHGHPSPRPPTLREALPRPSTEGFGNLSFPRQSFIFVVLKFSSPLCCFLDLFLSSFVSKSSLCNRHLAKSCPLPR